MNLLKQEFEINRSAFVLMGLFTASVLFSLAGMVILFHIPAMAGSAGAMLPYLQRVPTWVYLSTLPAISFLIYKEGLGVSRSLLYLVWGSFVGMMAELIGTGTGWPFGEYSYTAFLEPKILNDVPYFIPLSWYAISIVCLDFAARLRISRIQRIAVAALFMVLWDVALDPAMGVGFPLWTWNQEGFYYTMPAINWFGWFVTSAAIMWGYEILAGGPPAQPRRRMAELLWIVNGLFPVGILLVRGFITPAIIGAVAIALPLLVLGSRNATPASA